jgi:hypothetical protein
MSNVDKLIAKGAQIVGGDLILRHQVVGMFRYGDFILTPEGEAELAITDVEVKEVKKPRAKKAEAEPAPEDVVIEV